VQSLTVSTYVVPTEQPEADGTLAWDQTTVVLVEVVGGGLTGLGWAYSSRACRPTSPGPQASRSGSGSPRWPRPPVSSCPHTVLPPCTFTWRAP